MIAVVEANVAPLLTIVYSLLNFVDLFLEGLAIAVVANPNAKAESLLDVLIVLLIDVVLHNQLFERVYPIRLLLLEDVVGHLAPQLKAQFVPRHPVAFAINLGVVDQGYSQDWHFIHLGQPVLVNGRVLLLGKRLPHFVQDSVLQIVD